MSNKISIRGGASALVEEQVAHLSHDITLQSGVLNIVNNHWKVTEHNPQNLSVDIAVGRGYFKKTTMTYQGYSEEVNTASIGANNSGNSRIDAIVWYVDLGATPNSDASNVMKTMVVAGTPGATPAAPDDAAIQTAIGSGNPFIRIANVTVANGASAIANANIADTRVPCYMKMPGGIKDTEIINPKLSATYQKTDVGSVSGSKTLDCGTYGMFIYTLAAAVTLTLSGMRVGQSIYVIIPNTSAYVITWDTGIFFPDSVTPTPVGNYNGFIITCVATDKYIGTQAFNNVTVS